MSEDADFVAAALEREGAWYRADAERERLRSDLEFVGASVGAVRGTVRDLGRRRPGMTRDEAVALASELWGSRVYERRLAAVVLLQEHVDDLDNGDLTRIEGFVRDARLRALVDPLALDVIGPLVERLCGTARARADQALDRWAGEQDVWLRRAALLAPLRPIRAGGGDWDGFLRRARTAQAGPRGGHDVVREAVERVRDAARETRPDLA
ncbi:DNA alkylation repair protein [Clavibacter sp. VKM Ac-2872]|uniref:DNA alkylation repair protein n=1 Tax=Clavibacter sp. VKM Ac-2872 TaxID=2783812 RepID=UPI00188BF376|nr:DNA alkylation repair protein [Clavibacter sp. VKM Ac-2872]MBF4623848.1 DNA alkylation repair protein [Clavibacter sp. VKM Ac-2872]